MTIALPHMFCEETGCEHRSGQLCLCHSDLHYLTGALSIATPAVLGHEVAGTVQRVGAAVTHVAPGDRVVATITPSCGLCAAPGASPRLPRASLAAASARALARRCTVRRSPPMGTVAVIGCGGVGITSPRW
jgi:threonine dehydrogenase-like Zn-dependent dehydrogenase